MAETHGFVRYPPDSTGKRVPQTVMCEILYNNGTIPIIVGDVVTCVTSGISGTVLKVEGTTVSGEIHVVVNEPVPTTFPSNVGEDITVNSVVVAKIAAQPIPYYFQQMVLAGGNNALNHLYVNDDGAASVTFPEGPPQLDAFGKMQVSQQHKLAEYVMKYDALPTEFTTELVGGGTITHIPETAGCRLTCGTASGDKVTRTTNEYHVYQAGISQLMEFTAVLGDTGKANVVRRMGLFDDENGIFIEMYETTFNLVLRSKVSGVVTEEKIPNTTWNRDRLDGSGGAFNPSKIQVNPTMNNIYWLDFQWLGAGRVRFGMILDGVRVVAHEIFNSNARPTTYMSTANLPFRVQQENIGLVASTSEMTYYCSVVKTEGEYNPVKSPFNNSNSASITTTSAVPLLALRPTELYKTFPNRNVLFPNTVSVYNASSTDPVIMEMWLGTTATDGAWVAVGGESAAETNKTLTAFTGGQSRFSWIVGPGETHEFAPDTFRDNRRGLRRKADITQTLEMAITAKLPGAGTGGLVTVAFIWDEMRS